MPKTINCKIGAGGELYLSPSILEAAKIGPWEDVIITIMDRYIQIEPKGAIKYTLQKLLDQCDPDSPKSEKEWLAAKAVGNEII